MASDRERVADALNYFRPSPSTNGPVMLTPSKMREHLTVLENALNPYLDFTPTTEGIALLMGQVWLGAKGGHRDTVETFEDFAILAPEDCEACCSVAKAVLAALRQDRPATRGAGEGGSEQADWIRIPREPASEHMAHYRATVEMLRVNGLTADEAGYEAAVRVGLGAASAVAEGEAPKPDPTLTPTDGGDRG